MIEIGALVRIRYLDPRFEEHEGDLDEPGIFEVVGWVRPQRWPGWRSVASETGPDVRAVTHIPEDCITEELRLSVDEHELRRLPA